MNDTRRRGFLSATAAWLRHHTVAAPVLTLLASFLLGIIFWGGFNTFIVLTNTEVFCISCHEMREVYQEYRNTVHYSNRTGVRATCPDCHVPKDWSHMFVRKIQATNELFHHFKGSIDTPEKFTAKRLELAKIVWRSMEETDSQECRNCHGLQFMDTGLQRDVAGQRHLEARQQGKTCIDCHKGIAHTLAEEFLDQEHERFERENVPCTDCHEGMAHARPGDDWD